MFQTRKQLSDHETRLASLSLAVAELRVAVARHANEELFKLIKALQDDIDQTRVSLRSLHGKVAVSQRGTAAGGRADADIPSDEEFAAMMALQNAHMNGGH